MQMSAAKRFAYDDCSVARMPLSIIHAACQQSSRAASIFVAMSAIMKLTPWFIAIGMPNWTRSFEYCAAYSNAARATPTPPIAVPGLVKSSVFIAILKPWPSSPSRFSTGTRTSMNESADHEEDGGDNHPPPPPPPLSAAPSTPPAARAVWSFLDHYRCWRGKGFF